MSLHSPNYFVILSYSSLGCLEGMTAPFSGGYRGAVNPNLGPSKERKCIGGVVTCEKCRIVCHRSKERGACLSNLFHLLLAATILEKEQPSKGDHQALVAMSLSEST